MGAAIISMTNRSNKESDEAPDQRVLIQDLDVPVLGFARYLSELRTRNNSLVQQCFTEMETIRNGMSTQNADLLEFKRSTATVQQQMQSQMAGLKNTLTDAYSDIHKMMKTSDHQQAKTLELETFKSASSHSHQQLQRHMAQLEAEVNNLRLKNDDASRLSHISTEQNVRVVSDAEAVTQQTNSELKKLKLDHDKAISDLQNDVSRWNDALRELSKEIHDFQKLANANHIKTETSLWELQTKIGRLHTPQPGHQGHVPHTHNIAVSDNARLEMGTTMSAPSSPRRVVSLPSMMHVQSAQALQPSPQVRALAPMGMARYGQEHNNTTIHYLSGPTPEEMGGFSPQVRHSIPFNGGLQQHWIGPQPHH